jgi:hypothetical protein
MASTAFTDLLASAPADPAAAQDALTQLQGLLRELTAPAMEPHVDAVLSWIRRLYAIESLRTDCRLSPLVLQAISRCVMTLGVTRLCAAAGDVAAWMSMCPTDTEVTKQGIKLISDLVRVEPGSSRPVPYASSCGPAVIVAVVHHAARADVATPAMAWVADVVGRGYHCSLRTFGAPPDLLVQLINAQPRNARLIATIARLCTDLMQDEHRQQSLLRDGTLDALGGLLACDTLDDDAATAIAVCLRAGVRRGGVEAGDEALICQLATRVSAALSSILARKVRRGVDHVAIALLDTAAEVANAPCAGQHPLVAAGILESLSLALREPRGGMSAAKYATLVLANLARRDADVQARLLGSDASLLRGVLAAVGCGAPSAADGFATLCLHLASAGPPCAQRLLFFDGGAATAFLCSMMLCGQRQPGSTALRAVQLLWASATTDEARQVVVDAGACEGALAVVRGSGASAMFFDAIVALSAHPVGAGRLRESGGIDVLLSLVRTASQQGAPTLPAVCVGAVTVASRLWPLMHTALSAEVAQFAELLGASAAGMIRAPARSFPVRRGPRVIPEFLAACCRIAAIPGGLSLLSDASTPLTARTLWAALPAESLQTLRSDATQELRTAAVRRRVHILAGRSRAAANRISADSASGSVSGDAAVAGCCH